MWRRLVRFFVVVTLLVSSCIPNTLRRERQRTVAITIVTAAIGPAKANGKAWDSFDVVPRGLVTAITTSLEQIDWETRVAMHLGRSEQA